MTISIFRWADGPFVLFDDLDRQRRYALDTGRARALLDRLESHVDGRLDRSLVVEQRVTRDPNRDLTVTDIYVQDCDNLFEVMTATGPMLSLSPTEAGTLLLVAVDASARAEILEAGAIPAVIQHSPPLESSVDLMGALPALALPLPAMTSAMTALMALSDVALS
ncbi:MAG TPA: hypothetical protein VFP05_15685 [Thermomicrobiales bacterium]|nr:hypothetical protein [Thermomicrobiales bacterium]